jgi:hypothetical protein
LVPTPIRAGRDISTPVINAVPVGSRFLQPGPPLRRKEGMRVCPENRPLPLVQGWVTPMGRAGVGGDEVRYLQLISPTGPAHSPPPLPHPPQACKPAVQEASLNSNEGKRLPTTQPAMLKALEDTMEAAATENSPTWLALLASWCQVMANIGTTDLLRRSVPVELYDDRIVFFCKQSKRKHNRAGFYWVVPSTTSGGYVWTDKFFEEYHRRRAGIFGTSDDALSLLTGYPQQQFSQHICHEGGSDYSLTTSAGDGDSGPTILGMANPPPEARFIKTSSSSEQTPEPVSRKYQL